MKKKMNKQRGGWFPNALNPSDRRGLKAASLNQLTRKFRLSYERGENGNDFDGKTMQDIDKLVNEANPEQPLRLTQQWFFFTPDEVKKTSDEIADCVNTDRKDFNEYVSDLRYLVTYFSDRPIVARKMIDLIHDLCPANTQVATAIPVADAEEVLSGESNGLPVAEAAIVEGGRRKSRARKLGGKSKKRNTKRLRKSLRNRH
jgi:hypothetical protein